MTASEYERRFIQQYIVKAKQDRLQYELGGKKRQTALGRFAHGAAVLLRQEKIIACGTELNFEKLSALAREYSAAKEWYMMAYHAQLDRSFGTCEEMLRLSLGNGMPAILVSQAMAIVETEQEFGSPERFVLL